LKFDVSLKLFYSSNYKPNLFKSLSVNTENQKIFCRNFFFFLLFIEYFFLNKLHFLKCRLFIKKSNKTLSPIIRAPSRYKKAQFKVIKNVYNIVVSCSYSQFFKLSSNRLSFFYLLNKYLKLLNFFESSIIFLKKKKIVVREINIDNMVNFLN
jgi:hypothetical protein